MGVKINPSELVKNAVSNVGQGNVNVGDGSLQDSSIVTLIPAIEGECNAMVSGKVGGTVNLGNFSNLKVSVGFTLPCTPETMDAVFNGGLKWAEAKYAAYVEEAKNS